VTLSRATARPATGNRTARRCRTEHHFQKT